MPVSDATIAALTATLAEAEANPLAQAHWARQREVNRLASEASDDLLGGCSVDVPPTDEEAPAVAAARAAASALYQAENTC